MDWTTQLTGIPGDYSPIKSTITQADGQCLQAIYDELNDHALSSGKTLLDYVNNKTRIFVQNDENTINWNA